MSSDQVITSLSYNRPRNVATKTTNLQQEYRVSYPVTNQAKIEWYSTLDPDVIAQVSTIKITAGSAGNYYCITITSGSDTAAYAYKQQSGDTADAIASNLAKVIDTFSRVAATSSGNTVTVTGTTPGESFSIQDDGSTTAANMTIATTTTASGTPKHRKIGETILTFGVNANGFPTVSPSVSWLDGGATPSQLQVPVVFNATGARSLDQIQTEQGVTRPS